ncbi:MAG: nickel pincer cofactor biosynthesis protein LarC [Haloferacaceae archaeon]
MNVLAFDGRMGASGDMLLGALLAAGADRDALAPVEESLPVRYDVGETVVGGIAATTVHVRHDDAAGERDSADGGDSDADSGDDAPDHDRPHDHAEGAGPTRTYAEVVDLVESMSLPAEARGRALAVVDRLGEAEAAVHGTSLEDTHFHAVGADDAVADVVGAALLLADLDPDRVVTTPVAAGSGEVETSHGTYPVPTPAVVELAERADWSLRGGPVEAELLTPTGAAILAEIAAGVDALPPLRIRAAGYGAGDRRFPDHPNVLRALVGEGQGDLARDDVAVLETNLDDVAPEVLGSLQETLGEAGARDVTVLPATMKKSRPGHLVKVVCKPADVERVARRLAEETGTLGVREHGAGHRWVASRAFETAELDVDGEAHEVAVKVASDLAGEVYDLSAEYDDALAVARETGLPVREVLRRAEAVVAERLDGLDE